MAAVWLRFRSELRGRWRSMLGLAVLVGIVGGTATAAAAGARRTDSAYDRLLREQRAYDVILTNYPLDEGVAVFDLDRVAQLPEVADWAHVNFEWVDFGAGVAAVADPSGRLGTEINRLEIRDGRMFDPNRLDEAVISFTLAETEGLEVGDSFPFIDPDTLPPLDELAPEDRRGVEEFFRKVPDGMITIVGIESAPGEFPPQFGNNGFLMHLTPAFGREFGSGLGGEALVAHLKRGADDVPAFRQRLDALSGGLAFNLIDQAEHARHVNRSIHLQAVALWVLAGLVVVAGGLVLLQVLSRQGLLDAGEHPVLRSLGMSTGQLRILGVLRAGLVGAVGSVLAVGLAVLASPLTPTGLARVAETDAGLAVDGVVLAVGGVLTVVGAIALSLPAVWTAARALRTLPGQGRERISWVARSAAVLAMPVAATAGIRMALEPGRGRSAVPVRTTVAGVALGIAVLASALVFGASLARLLDTPRLYGQTWDIESVDFAGDGFSDGDLAEIARHPDVVGVGVGEAGFGTVEVDGKAIGFVAVRDFRGEMTPPAVGGRPPERADEIALGRKTARAIGARIGDILSVRVPPGRAVEMLFVGEVVLPALDSSTQLGQGALLRPEAFTMLEPENEDAADSSLFVALRRGADRDVVVAELSEALGEPLYVFDRGAPNDIVNFGRVEEMPFVLGAILGGVALLTLAYTAATAVRRRARDLAVLRALGFVGRQVSVAVLTQASTIALIALLIGVPTGVAAGRWAWDAVARDLGVVSEPRIAVLALVLVAGAALVLANVLGALPAWAAARLRPAVVLRSE